MFPKLLPRAARRRFAENPPRAVAAIFAGISTIGAVPGLWVVTMLVDVMARSAAHPHELDIVRFPILAFFLLGFGQLAFYWIRALGKNVTSALGWWVSTYFYNGALALVSFIALMTGNLLMAMPMLFFIGLTWLALIAFHTEPHAARRGGSDV